MNYSIHFVFLIVCSKCIAVNINRIVVPALVELGTESVILDCDYNTGETPGPGLVIKWFFNGSTGLVYQWIPPLQPQVIGLLKGKVDMSFKISDEPLQAYRAIKIINPGTHLSGNYTCVVSTFIAEDSQTRSMLVYNEPLQAYRAIKIINPGTHLSGNYTCVVSTFIAEDSQTRSMLVYSPGKSFHFDQEKKYVFLVTLKCVAEYLYPRPVMTILSKGKPLERSITDMRMDSWGMYTVETTALVHDDDVTSPWEEFVCVLSLPLANYTTNRTTVYYPGLMPTHSASIEVKKPMEHQASNSSTLRLGCILLVTLLLSINFTF